jgi:hypothetical protein
MGHVVPNLRVANVMERLSGARYFSGDAAKIIPFGKRASKTDFVKKAQRRSAACDNVSRLPPHPRRISFVYLPS